MWQALHFEKKILPVLTNAVQMQPQPLPKFFKVALNIDSKGGIIIF